MKKTITTRIEKLWNAFLERVAIFEQINRRNNKTLADIVKWNRIDSNITTTFANISIAFIRSQFCLSHLSCSKFQKKTNFSQKFKIK